MAGSRTRAVWLVAALIALAMLGYAVVQSTVMQVAMAAPQTAPVCDGAMAGMAMAAYSARHAPAKPASLKSCPYCAAAAHPPIVGFAFVLPTPQAALFSPTLRVAVKGPRGPPAFRPRARGPPPTPLL